MALGFHNKDNINEAKQSKPKRNFATAIKQNKQKENKSSQSSKNKDKDLTPVTTMKVHKDSLMALSAVQNLFFLNTRTEAFTKIMKDIVPYYIKNHKINKSNFDFLYRMYMKKK